jgi:hypothetical protein
LAGAFLATGFFSSFASATFLVAGFVAFSTFSSFLGSTQSTVAVAASDLSQFFPKRFEKKSLCL